MARLAPLLVALLVLAGARPFADVFASRLGGVLGEALPFFVGLVGVTAGYSPPLRSSFFSVTWSTDITGISATERLRKSRSWP